MRLSETWGSFDERDRFKWWYVCRLGPMTDAAEPTDALAGGTRRRLEMDLHSALKRRPAHEGRLAGVTRALAPISADWRRQLLVVLEIMVRRGSFERPLYGAVVRSLAQADQSPEVASLISRALGSEQGMVLPTLSAACFCKHPQLGEALARAATSRHAHLAFAAEVARLSRGETDGAVVTSLAPKIKESHRIALCLELLAPLLSCPPLPRGIAPALAVLRGAERHLGRWLVLAEIAARSGDAAPREQARERAKSGTTSARDAWSLVLWALEPNGGIPSVRPTIELVARLSDRPSANKDKTFLFRLAAAGVESARPMLESLTRADLIDEDCTVRAMLHLLCNYREERYREQLEGLADAKKHESIRGLAAACLYDSGDVNRAMKTADALEGSRHLSALAWSSLIRAHHLLGRREKLVSEQRFRRVQRGFVE